jgi:tetratricopeptide (TPR) repeat protein
MSDWEMNGVYCHHCGKKQTEDAVYCSKCGKQLLEEEDAGAAIGSEMAAGLSEAAASLETEPINGEKTILPNESRKQIGGRSAWTWLTPVALAAVTTASVFTYYIYQSGINDKVIKLQTQAKSEALAGKYKEALATLKEAAEARPDFAAIQADAAIVTHAAELEQSVAAAGEQIGEHKLSEAEQMLERVKDGLKGHSEPVYAKVKEQLEASNLKLNVIKLTDELVELKTVDELAAKLNVANHLDGEEAAAVREQIVAKIVDVSYSQAEALLEQRNYTDALTVTAIALTFAKDDERLTALEKRINQEQAQYEKTEQQRLEQAMQKAAKEDLKNQTAAVEVVHIETTLDEFGDVTIEAELKNAATRPIYSVKVEYTVYDSGGHEVGSGTAEVSPDYIEPGEKMSFTATVYGVYVENTTVVVDHATWHLD